MESHETHIIYSFPGVVQTYDTCKYEFEVFTCTLLQQRRRGPAIEGVVKDEFHGSYSYIMSWWEVFVACVVANAVTAQISADWVQFESFLKRYDKKYVDDSAEITKRFAIFKVTNS